MNGRRIGIAATALAVALLLGSLVMGLRDSNAEGPARDTPAERPIPQLDQRVRVEVLNAAGVPRLARAATERLRAAGFDVVYYGNAPSFGRDTTIAIARLGDSTAASAVAAAIGSPAEARVEHDSTRFVDVSVLLGTDLSHLTQ